MGSIWSIALLVGLVMLVGAVSSSGGMAEPLPRRPAADERSGRYIEGQGWFTR